MAQDAAHSRREHDHRARAKRDQHECMVVYEAAHRAGLNVQTGAEKGDVAVVRLYGVGLQDEEEQGQHLLREIHAFEGD